MAKTLFTQIHPRTLANRSTQEAFLPDFLAFVESINLRIQQVNVSLPSYMAPGDLWPTDILFFDDIFNTPDEAETFLNTKASLSCAAACKTTGGATGTPRENTPSWVIVCPLCSPRPS